MPRLGSPDEGTSAKGPGSPGLNSSGRRVTGEAPGRQLEVQGLRKVGVPDSRINVLKATTPSSPCRKMPKLCMSAPLSQRPAPDATVEGGPPGSPWLAFPFPAGPCMAGLGEERETPWIGSHSLPASGVRATEPRARSSESQPGAGSSAPRPTRRRA